MSLTYCYNCGKFTGGKPLFCGSCGRSYDVKLCPRLHQNPRGAEVCSQCGSRELSTPQPKIPMSWRLLALLARLGLGLLLFYASLSLVIALLGFSRSSPRQSYPQHCPQRPDPLGTPLAIRDVARLIGCSAWTVRQSYIPQGLPHLRSGPSGKLIFYREQVVRWILERQQKGGNRT